MDPKDRSNMFKAKTNGMTRNDLAKNQLREKRAAARLNVHSTHRHIEPTPKKPKIADGPSKLPANDAVAETNGGVPASKLSRQQEFRQRFQQYREMKAAEKANKGTHAAPFSSAVPSGRFINNNAKLAPVQRAINTKKSTAIRQMAKDNQQQNKDDNNGNTKFSPIATRSKKKTDLYSPSQLPTPRRRSRKSFTKPSEPVAAAVATNRTPQPVMKQKSGGDRLASEKKSTLAVNRTPKIQMPFVFSASTAVKTEPLQRDRVVDRRESVQKLMFNESISPIEATTVAKSVATSGDATSNDTIMAAEAVTATASAVARAAAPEPEADLNTTPVNTEALNHSNYVSPFVTISRGGRQSRAKEEQARQAKYTLTSRRSLLNESQEERQNVEAANHFRQKVTAETDRLMGMVNEWLKYKDEHPDEIPSDYVDLIDVAAGQTRLLTTNKFKQFLGLIEQCERGNKEAQPVHPIDLEGFWNMVYMQVENCDKRFERLQQLKSNGWEDPELKRKAKKPKRPALNGVTNTTSFKAKAPRSNSALSQMLRAARQKHEETKALELKNAVLATIQNESTRRISSPRKITKRKTVFVVSIYTYTYHI